MIVEQLPPHNLEAEQAVIGSLLLNPEAVHEVKGVLKAADFYNSLDGKIYETVERLSRERAPIDVLTVSAAMPDHKDIITHLVGATCEVPTSLNIGRYAKIVRDCAIRRGMLQGAGEIAKLAYDLEIEVEEAQSGATAVASGFVREQPSEHVTTAQAAALLLYNRSEEAMQGKIPPRLTIPFVSLRELRPKKGNFLIIGARPAMGKTSFICQLALMFARQGKRVLFFSLEMSSEEITQRMMAIESGISHYLLDGDERTDQMTDAQWQAYGRAVNDMGRLDIVIHDKRGITVEGLETIVSRDVLVNGDNTVVMVDHIHLLNAQGFNAQFSVQMATHISKKLKAIAGNGRIWMIAAAQLSRAVEQRSDKRPMLSDLRESGSLEQDADAVSFLYRDEYYNPDTTDSPGIAEIITAKHRNGSTFTAKLGWNGERMMFSDL
jgi:replicative DNA helicase